MIDKVYEDLHIKYLNFGRWTEEIIREGLQEAYKLGQKNIPEDVLYAKYVQEHEENNL